MALSIGIALLGSGASTLMTPGSETTVVFAVTLFMPIVILILTIPHAIEGHWGNSVLSMMFLPVAAWVYTSNIGFVREHPGVAYLAIALGVGSLGFAARGPAPAPAPAGAGPAKGTAEQH
jgi:hypothetical protein